MKTLETGDLLEAASACRGALEPHVGADSDPVRP
jgi:hypothetical protein